MILDVSGLSQKFSVVGIKALSVVMCDVTICTDERLILEDARPRGSWNYHWEA